MTYVLKIGGSLLSYPDDLRRLCARLAALAGEFNMLVVPGGGVFADAVRGVYSTLKLPEETAHSMAVLAMDQYGLLLQTFFNGSARLIYGVNRASSCFKEGKVAILMASHMLLNEKTLPRSWDVTSDSTAAYVAKLIGAEALILVKVVDGLTERGSRRLLKKVSVESLVSQVEGGCIDRYIPNLLKPSRLRCFIVNGRFPERVEGILRGRESVYTEVVYS